MPYIDFEKVRGDLCIYRCVPPTHEYGTRPFLRWARSQGRSPHVSGKAKNTFGPVGIPLFGAPQAPGNKPNPPKGLPATVTHLQKTQGPTYYPATLKRTFSHSDSFTSSMIINISLMCFQRSFIIYLYCQLIYSVMETNY